MDSAKSQLADKLKSANNILVTVSRNPSVDQLSALLGLTLFLNKSGKHAAAVFSGDVPSTIEFLQPEETIEKNTDSLRDFIIALDKSKADKLRYKVEDNVVRIFITPYKTSISEDDLDFSQGDFNVDAVVGLGVKQQEDFDDAITAHGRILHDATVASINASADGGLGTINWHDAQASSLSELVTELAQSMKSDAIDEQIATALLTGIVAETERFSNDKTSAQTMSVSAALMAAGANQQLVASKLNEPTTTAANDKPADVQGADESEEKTNDGTLAISHSRDEKQESDSEPAFELPAPQDDSDEPTETASDEQDSPAIERMSSGPKLVTEPPTLGGTLTANTQAEGLDPVTDPLSMPRSEDAKILSRDDSTLPSSPDPVEPVQPTPPEPPTPPLEPPTTPEPTPEEQPAPAEPAPEPAPAQPEPPAEPQAPEEAAPANTSGTLADLEASVHSDHLNAGEHLDAARDEVSQALKEAGGATPEPIQALNSQPLSENLHPDAPTEQPPAGPPAADPTAPDPSLTDQIPGLTIPADVPAEDSKPADPAADNQPPQVLDPNAPPPVPPPIPFQFGNNAPPPQDK
jgi:nanoRNase/pAp phosphatase (c-di-AMP/oligoRNAs hydrolase)